MYNSRSYRTYNDFISKLRFDDDFRYYEGLLEVKVVDAVSKEPVAARMELFRLDIMGQYSERATSTHLNTYYTDDNGNFPIIELPLSNYPNLRYFANIEAAGYNMLQLLNVPIYENVLTTYNNEMNRALPNMRVRDIIRTPTKYEPYNPEFYF